MTWLKNLLNFCIRDKTKNENKDIIIKDIDTSINTKPVYDINIKTVKIKNISFK